MKHQTTNWGCWILAGALFLARAVPAQSAPAAPAADNSILLTIEGAVEISGAGSVVWTPALTNQILHTGDRLRTGPRSRATVRLSNLTVLRVNELTTLLIQPPSAPGKASELNVQKGGAYFYSRERPTEMKFQTPLVSGAIRGTEFNLAVADDGRTVVSLLDGEVALTNSSGSTNLVSGEQGIIEPGQPPRKTALINAINVIQWVLYYPAVLNPDELNFTDAEKSELAASLAAYRAGDLLAALANWPAARAPGADSEKIYYAELLLSAGQVEQTEAQWGSIQSPPADALRETVAAVKFQKFPSATHSSSASVLLADSYYLQSQSQLAAALAAARAATEKSPDFGFAWERLAELEFSFGRTSDALDALEKSLRLAPRNPEALALKGFLLAAQNKSAAARELFDDAIAVDGALGNAWLGRGLTRIHAGDAAGGTRDLQVAATLEPNRSLFRSYLGKAFASQFDDARAEKELSLANKFDPNDPTSWLYLALLDQNGNKINDAINDLQESQARNDNRSLFRSKLLLDQDRAVGSANLASIYGDAGMNDVGVREAAGAVNDDYANAPAHMFLSDAYNNLRDPTGFNLRYETAWFNEWLLANLLSPVGGGRLSQAVSQQEYSKLFQQDGLGFANSTDARSDGMYREQVSQFGTFGNTAYAVDLDYQHNNGVRPNNTLDDTSVDATVKQQLTPSDTVMGILQFENYHSGDNFQYYDPNTSYRPNFEYAEHQTPTLVGGYQHEWAPGIRSLLLGGRLEMEQHFSDVQAPQLAVAQDSTGATDYARGEPFDVQLRDKLEIYSAELCQIVQEDKYTLIVGGRWQGGQFTYSDTLTPNPPEPGLYNPAAGSFSSPFQRLGGYGYLTVEPVDKLWLTGGAAYDTMTYPSNFRNQPQSPGTTERQLLEPKAAVIWSPFKQVTLRGIYSRSLGGVSLDDSYRLEPTELAGFVQTFRSVIPESVVGSVSGEGVELEGLALDLKFGCGTFVGLEVQHMDSIVRQTIGDFLLQDGAIPFVPSTTPENLNYDEQSLSASINQLLPDGFVVGFNYSLTHSELKTTFPQIPPAFLSPQDQSACLHQIGAYLLFNHPSGLFGQFDAHGCLQQNNGYTPAEPGDNFVQLDVQGGWRFFHRRAELLVGILNLTGQNYRLNPLNVHSELPRSRVFQAQLRFEF